MRVAEFGQAFFVEVVEPLLRAKFDEPLIAGRFGHGSDVLGLDDGMSQDHDWGLRLTILTDAPGAADILESSLPSYFAGLPVRFATTWDARETHRVEVDSLEKFVRDRLGVHPDEWWSVDDWLSFTGQSVLEVISGPVFADDEGRWARMRRRLEWYPDDVWRYAIAGCWKQLEQELPFIGRTGLRGDDLGSRLIAARLVQVCVRLGLLLDRQWAPYSKWLGTVFAASQVGSVSPELHECPEAGDWTARERALCLGLEGLRQRQADLGLPVADAAVEPFHDRPFRGVPPAAAEVLLASIGDPAVRNLPVGVGPIDQWTANVDVLVRPELRRAIVRAGFPAEASISAVTKGCGSENGRPLPSNP